MGKRTAQLSSLVAALLLAVVIAPCLGGPSGTAEYVWWEGESAVESNFPPISGFSPSTFPDTRHLLSGGDWLSISDKRTGDEAYARYRVEVPADAEYELWVRKFWLHGPFRWRFGTSDWQVCGRDVALADDTYLRQYVGANWVFLGKVQLPEGVQSFEIRLLAGPGEDQVACFDCFILSRGPFVPNGKWKPGERSGLADPGFFPFEPPTDHFGSEALLDLRSLNEEVAGENGFIRREGHDFVLGNSEPVRFWAVNVGPGNAAQYRGSVDYLARRLAKLGVNMVRFHGPLFQRDGDPSRIDPGAMDNLFYLVTALKRQGIYTSLSLYFPLWFDVQPGYGIPGYEGIENKKPFALLYFDPRMQAIYKAWARTLLTTTNPYTGLPLAREPALAIIEIINEDSFFFWTFSKSNIPPVHWDRLERLFGDWLGKRYGSLEAAFAAWGGESLPEDDAVAGRAGLYEAWHMTADGIRAGGAGKPKRVGDQVRFLTELQRGFYQDIVRYFREELGTGSLISASNWTVADARMLDALERYTYTAGDVIDRHGYFGGPHEGEGAGYSVRVEHTFESLAAVTVPEQLPLQFVEVEDYPTIISEIGWTNPNRFRADATFLASAYGALQGVDGIYFFAVGSNYLLDRSMGKFAVSSPVTAGTFPAAALQYRRGDVREAEDVIYEIVSLDDLYAMKGSALWSTAALDELRKKDIPAGAEVTGEVKGIDPQAFYVGRVIRAYGDRPERSRQRDLSAFIQRDKKTIKSLTGELLWNYCIGVVMVDTPRSQGAAGFLPKAGRIELSDVAITCDNEFASVVVVSLDGRPLAKSKRILIQAMTEEQPYGFRTEGNRITSMGGSPFGVRKLGIQVALRLEGTGDPRVVALDENGYATAKTVVTRRTGGEKSFAVQLAPDSIYHVVERP